MQDLPGLLVAERILHPPLKQREGAQGRRCQLRRERDGLKAGDQAVAPEDRHEPGEPRRRKRTGGDSGPEPQGRHVHQAAPVDLLHRFPRTDQPGGRAHPGVDVGLGAHRHVTGGARRSLHVEGDGPGGARRQVNVKAQTVLGNLGLLAGRDVRFADEALAFVSQRQPIVRRLRVELPLLRQLVLHLEQIGEVAAGVQLDVEVHRLLVVVLEQDLLVKPLAHGALAGDREMRVDVDGAGGDRLEELHLKVFLLVDGQHRGAEAVDGQDPAGEEACVVEKQPLRIDRTGFDVAAPIADHE